MFLVHSAVFLVCVSTEKWTGDSWGHIGQTEPSMGTVNMSLATGRMCDSLACSEVVGSLVTLLLATASPSKAKIH